MALTCQNLVEQRSWLGGTQRIYELGDYRLSLINSPEVHSFPFSWEAAVFYKDELTYKTLLTSDVEVFESEDEANLWIRLALVWMSIQ